MRICPEKRTSPFSFVANSQEVPRVADTSTVTPPATSADSLELGEAELVATDSAAELDGVAAVVTTISVSFAFSESKKKFEHPRRESEQLLILLREFSRKFA